MKADLSLYLVLDPDLCGGLDGMLRVTEAAVAGGAGVVQLRAPTWKKRQWLEAAQALLPLCHAGGAKLVINDQLDVALIAGADGVHLGQQDLPVAAARRLLGPDALLGLSVSRLEQLESVPPSGVDYLGVGPVFATATKADADAPCGVAGLAAIVRASPLPVVAIGGIDAGNAAPLFAVGAAGVAVVSAICASRDPLAAARALHALSRPSTMPA
ncbi:MAG: thiamine phosphate synthase [Paludibacterium sp.]|uniref:thiamine phosphate synthase n=1 Tax=Paludibacterium sp. TaxID=1917523 RepID=UPI0025DE1808|nr:thiamine phosphate synthase [Paludibacterium sp.]MBV8048802.1 thiamine phosphate synthase [Paludibacterium sp.]MBV8645912.1 thiamine phosphate synthase [Paludibacterium sp.]